jgi:hypothetical protein
MPDRERGNPRQGDSLRCNFDAISICAKLVRDDKTPFLRRPIAIKTATLLCISRV